MNSITEYLDNLITKLSAVNLKASIVFNSEYYVRISITTNNPLTNKDIHNISEILDGWVKKGVGEVEIVTLNNQQVKISNHTSYYNRDTQDILQDIRKENLQTLIEE